MDSDVSKTNLWIVRVITNRIWAKSVMCYGKCMIYSRDKLKLINNTNNRDREVILYLTDCRPTERQSRQLKGSG